MDKDFVAITYVYINGRGWLKRQPQSSEVLSDPSVSLNFHNTQLYLSIELYSAYKGLPISLGLENMRNCSSFFSKSVIKYNLKMQNKNGVGKNLIVNLYRNNNGLRPLSRLFGMATLSILLCGCSPRHFIAQEIGTELASQGKNIEEDLMLAREASAFYLKLSESVLRKTPDNLKLAEAVAGGFTQYAYAFVSFEAERIETKDFRAAQQLRMRAARLYLRAHRHAMASLEQHNPGFLKALSSPQPENWPRLEDEEIALAYWAAASWGGYISLSKDDPNIVADLPLAIRLAHLAWDKTPNHGDGALASLMGTFETARPGGSRQQAVVYFDLAISASAGKSAGPLVAKAEGIALPAGDRAMFDSLLRQAIITSDTQRDLQNEVMRERALWLLETADDLF